MTDDWFLHLIKEHTITNLNTGKTYINKNTVHTSDKIKTLYAIFKDYYKTLQSYKGNISTTEEYRYYYDATDKLIGSLSRTFKLDREDIRILLDDLQILNAYINREGTLNSIRSRLDSMSLALNKKRNSIRSKRTERFKKQVELDNYMAHKWQVGNYNDPTYKKLKDDLIAINSELSKVTTNYERNTASRNTRSSRGGKRTSSTRKNKSK
uniref:Uncharacterized protein n=1 Tax=viral metagenome TaxID=1070528 RepID=A0A6C0AP40_9ZZZZ